MRPHPRQAYSCRQAQLDRRGSSQPLLRRVVAAGMQSSHLSANEQDGTIEPASAQLDNWSQGCCAISPTTIAEAHSAGGHDTRRGAGAGEVTAAIERWMRAQDSFERQQRPRDTRSSLSRL